MKEVEPNFKKRDGLIVAIAQDFKTKEVLMQAFMNEEAWQLTLKTGKAYFWSTSRKKLWCKGEDSGNIMEVKEIRVDCDEDAMLLLVKVLGNGVACHTGERSCFFRKVVCLFSFEYKIEKISE